MTAQEFINSLNNAINKNGGSNSNGGAHGPGFKLSGKFLRIIIFIILVVVGGTTSFYMVDQTEEAVVTQFGKYNRTTAPGLHFKLPFFIERNFNVPTRKIQSTSFGFRTAKADVVSLRSSGDYSSESTMLTGDLNIVNVEWIIQYRISNPKAYLFNVMDPNKTIRDISISVVNQHVGDYYITDVLGDARTEIETSALANMNQIFDDYELGISVTAVKLQNIVPPVGKVQDAFEDVNKAVQDMNRLINEGREEYNKQIPKSRGQAAQRLEQAQGYATERVNQARGDVARFTAVLQEYRRNPEVTKNRLYYETVESILERKEDNGNTQFIDGQFENLVPFLPLGNTNTQLGPQQ